MGVDVDEEVNNGGDVDGDGGVDVRQGPGELPNGLVVRPPGGHRRYSAGLIQPLLKAPWVGFPSDKATS